MRRTSTTELSRRTFLQRTAMTACAAPLFVPANALGRSRQRAAPNDRVTMALVGCGSMGGANLNSFLRQPDVQIVAVCDPDLTRRLEKKGAVERHYAKSTRDGTYRGCDDYNDFRDVMARGDIDAVIQATPDHWHALIVVAAARSGKDCYGEKPLSLTIDQGRVMADTVRHYGRVFQTGSQQRSDRRFRHACELVRNGRIGRVHAVTCGLPGGSATANHPVIPVPDGFDYERWLGPAPRVPYCDKRTHWDFRWILDYSGGQVTDWGAHHIDIAHWGLGLEETGPVLVGGRGEFPTDGLWNAAVNYRFTARYRTGVEITITNDFENGVKWEGEDGWVFVNRGRIDADPRSLLDEEIGANEKRLLRSPGHHRNFLDCVRSRRDPIAPIEQAHRTITVAHLGNIAMKLGRPVRWNPDTERFVNDPTAELMRDRAMREPWSL
ncbi:MAG: Gfo/Idh/MocA family protein [Planctomycetota bacterium]|jgi:predicted dehydrogenase